MRLEFLDIRSHIIENECTRLFVRFNDCAIRFKRNILCQGRQVAERLHAGNQTEEQNKQQGNKTLHETISSKKT